MPDLLLELFSEEIPARMQAKAAEDLRKLVTDGLVAAGLTYEGAKAFVTPRRLALTVQGVTVRSADIREERKGPRVGAPARALEGFLRAAGLSSIDGATIQSDPKKGDFYVAVISRPGRPAEEIVAELVPDMIRSFPWPKSMRWGRRSAPEDSPFAGPEAEGTAALRWVRPLRSILCTFGPETEEPVVVPVEVSGLAAGNVTFGHRFMGTGAPIRVRRFEDYVEKLAAEKVVLDAERRRAVIETEARNLAFAQGFELVDDPALLDEVAGLVEWPGVLMGSFDQAFLEIPDEVVRLTIRQNQKCFVLRGNDPSRLPAAAPQDEGSGRNLNAPHGEVRAQASLEPSSSRLTNRFILVANSEASDGGVAIVAGNERVIRARLSDARFFWEQDQKIPLEKHAEKLGGITFHEKLGSQAERVERIARLARELAPLVGADPEDAERAARLAKADLVTGMVCEFPELQGVMGRYYALAQGEKPEIADAIRDHYKPAGPSDAVPTEPVSVAVALADKLDTLVGFWAIDEKPTGSKDPFALRRAALGVITIVIEQALSIPLLRLMRATDDLRAGQGAARSFGRQAALAQELESLGTVGAEHMRAAGQVGFFRAVSIAGVFYPSYLIEALFFLADRLKVYLRDRGAAHGLIDAVFQAGWRVDSEGENQVNKAQDDLLLIVRCIEALGKFLEAEDGANLLVGYRRAANILRAEEKKDGAGAFDGAPDPELITLPEERALFDAMDTADGEARTAAEDQDFAGAMAALAKLRPAVDAFFDKVTVNAEDPRIRANRLKLLNRLRQATLAVADFSRVGG